MLSFIKITIFNVQCRRLLLLILLLLWRHQQSLRSPAAVALCGSNIIIPSKCLHFASTIYLIRFEAATFAQPTLLLLRYTAAGPFKLSVDHLVMRNKRKSYPVLNGLHYLPTIQGIAMQFFLEWPSIYIQFNGRSSILISYPLHPRATNCAHHLLTKMALGADDKCDKPAAAVNS